MKCHLSHHWLYPERKRLLTRLNYFQWPPIRWKSTVTCSVLTAVTCGFSGWAILFWVWSLATPRILVVGCRLGPCWLCGFAEWLHSPIECLGTYSCMFYQLPPQVSPPHWTHFWAILAALALLRVAWPSFLLTLRWGRRPNVVFCDMASSRMSTTIQSCIISFRNSPQEQFLVSW